MKLSHQNTQHIYIYVHTWNCYISYFDKQNNERDQQLSLYSLILDNVIPYIESDNTNYRRITYSVISGITDGLENFETNKIDKNLYKLLHDKIVSFSSITQNVLNKSHNYWN